MASTPSQIQDSPASVAQTSPPSDTSTSAAALSTQVGENKEPSDTETAEEISVQTKKSNRKSSEVNPHFKLVTKRKLNGKGEEISEQRWECIHGCNPKADFSTTTGSNTKARHLRNVHNIDTIPVKVSLN